MDTTAGGNQLRRCPDQPTLVKYQTGRLADPISESLAGHLETCNRCLDALRELMTGPIDPFEARLLQFCTDRDVDSYAAEPAYSRLESIALALRLQKTHAGKVVGIPSTDFEVDGDTTIGPYTVIDVLGSGGMGVVYRAIHRRLKRTVALKTLRPGAETRSDSLVRFRTEGEAVARLDHHNIVRVYDCGESAGRPYLAMELIEGETLGTKLICDILSCDDAARLVRDLARAVGYAHEQKVLHRDLKPSNVLLTRDGIPKIVDFGLARLLGDHPRLTATEAVMGTPNYMAPEQADGRTADITEQTDIYALGVILYEALTGGPLYIGESRMEILNRVIKGDMSPPSHRRPEIPPALEIICLKCLELAPRDRYRSAGELALELECYLDHKPIQARRASRWRGARRAVQRRIPLVVGGVLLAAGLVAATVALLPRQTESAVPNGESVITLREMETVLESGQPVTLIGESGWPKWFRWQAGKDSQRMHIEPDGTFSAEMVERHSLGVLELLPDPRTDRYKVTAQIRHDLGAYGGYVGLYVGHRTYPWEDRDIQFFAHVKFSGVANGPIIIRPGTGKTVTREGNVHSMSLVTRVYSDVREPPIINVEPCSVSGGPLNALGPRNGVWHDFELVVTPDGIVATVAGHVMNLPATRMTPEILHNSIDSIRTKFPNDPMIQSLRPVYSPRGGIGMLLDPNVAASFRNVTITPIPASQ